MAAKYGQSHHNAKASDADVELARRCKEAGMKLREIAEKLEYPANTVRDWIYYRTRVTACPTPTPTSTPPNPRT